MALLRAPKMTAAAMTSLMLIDTAESSAWLARERFSFNCARIEAMLIDDHAGRDLPLVRVRLVPSNAETVRPGATALEPLTAKTERVAALGLLQQVGGPVRASAFRRYIGGATCRPLSAAGTVLGFAIDYYNGAIAKWEPLVQRTATPTHIQLDLDEKYSGAADAADDDHGRETQKPLS